MQILDVNGLPIDSLWCAEFRGFFLGEGNLEIGQYTRNYKGRKMHFLRPRARLIQRADNRAMLESVCLKLGGHVTGHISRKFTSHNGVSYVRNPIVAWQTTSVEGVKRVLDILDSCVFVHTKLREIEIMRRYLSTLTGRGHKKLEGVQDLQLAMKSELEQLRKYVDC